VTPDDELNQLGSIRAVGLSLLAIHFLNAVFYSVWVYWNRQLRIVKTMQPIFLVTIRIGVGVMVLGIVPLSIDDGIASTRGCDIVCMSVPWLLSLGFTLAFSALFSKLWRIFKLFNNQNFRRAKVIEKDVLAPFATLFTLSFAVLLTWTLVDPVHWSRDPIDGEQWNTFVSCKVDGTTSKISYALIGAFNVGALFLACYQAYKARNISDEFSESKNVGFAVFSWVQALMVGLPGPRHARVIVSGLPLGLPLEEAFSATIATAGLLSTYIVTEAAKVGAKSSVNGGLRLNLEEDVGKNEVVSLCSKSHEQLKKWNEQPESARKQIHDGVTEDDSGGDDEQLRKGDNSSAAPSLAMPIESDIVGV
jgi:hypothetical protein